MTNTWKVDPREAKLPAWVRAEFDRLRRRTENAERDRDEARLATDPSTSDTVLDPYNDIPIGLGKGTAIRFRLGSEGRMEWADAKVRHDRDGAYMQIRSGGTMTIEPRSGNLVHLRAR